MAKIFRIRGAILVIPRREFEGHIRGRIAYKSSACNAPLLLCLLLSDKGALVVFIDAMLTLVQVTL